MIILLSVFPMEVEFSVNKLALETNIFNSVAVLVSQLTNELLNNSNAINKTSVLQINGLETRLFHLG